MNYRVNTKDILITQLGEEGVAFNSSTNEYFSLNETSFKILKGIENNWSVETICQQLKEQYDISDVACTSAVEDTLQSLISKKLIIEE